MNLDDRLTKDGVKKLKVLKDPYYEDEPDYAAYIEHEKRPSLNEYRGVFVSSDETSINKRPNVFDRTAVFKTGDSL